MMNCEKSSEDTVSVPALKVFQPARRSIINPFPWRNSGSMANAGGEAVAGCRENPFWLEQGARLQDNDRVSRKAPGCSQGEVQFDMLSAILFASRAIPFRVSSNLRKTDEDIGRHKPSINRSSW
jgi:hypothetical protein